MKNKLLSILLITPIVLFFGWIIFCAVYNKNRPIHKVKVDYIIYRGSKPYHKSEVYKVRGTEFEYCIRTEKQKHGYGPNVFFIQDKHNLGFYVSNQCVCIYSGYNDVECKSIKIIE